jgi:hypothetical protein
MPRPPTDKALRRFVTELSRATPEDIEAILAHLEPGHRARAQALLAEFSAGPDTIKGRGRVSGERPGPRGLSSWLEDRIFAAGDPERARGATQRRIPPAAPNRARASFTMTGEALKALHSAALAAEPGAPGAGSARLAGWASDLGRRYLRPGQRP